MHFINKRFQYTKLCHIIAIFIILIIKNKLINAKEYQQSKCELHYKNFSLDWAFEPLSKNVVFLLKTKIPSQNSTQSIAKTAENNESENIKEFITGIGIQKSNVS